MWPLHSWLPDAHVEAPTAGSVILAGVLLKMGTYGFLRFNLPLFPQASLQAAPWIALFAVIGIIYGAAVSYAQSDVKKLVAYSSVSHLGFVMLGLFALNSQGIAGAILQMINHGLSTGALFLLVGMIYEQTHTRELKVYGGLWKITPIFGTIMLIVALSSMGLPGLNGFVGEFVILLGAWGAGMPGGALSAFGGVWFAGIAAIGIIMAAVYILYMFQKMFLGPQGEIVDEVKQSWARHPRPQLARDPHHYAAAHLYLLDRSLPRAVLRSDGARSGQTRSHITNCCIGDALISIQLSAISHLLTAESRWLKAIYNSI